MSKNNKTRTKDKYRVVYNDIQRIELENEFRSSEYITIPRKQEIASKLQLSERQIKIWFQNRRAKKRKQQKRRYQPPPPLAVTTTTTTTTSADSPTQLAVTAMQTQPATPSSTGTSPHSHLHQQSPHTIQHHQQRAQTTLLTQPGIGPTPNGHPRTATGLGGSTSPAEMGAGLQHGGFILDHSMQQQQQQQDHHLQYNHMRSNHHHQHNLHHDHHHQQQYPTLPPANHHHPQQQQQQQQHHLHHDHLHQQEYPTLPPANHHHHSQQQQQPHHHHHQLSYHQNQHHFPQQESMFHHSQQQHRHHHHHHSALLSTHQQPIMEEQPYHTASMLLPNY